MEEVRIPCRGHAGNMCGSPSPVLRRRVQNSITRSRQNQPPRAPKWALGGLRRNRRWEALRPPQRRQESFREDILGATFATHARSMRNDETWFKNQHVWSALNRFRIDPGSLQIDRGTRIEPGIGHAVGPLARRISALLWSPVAKQRASARPRLLPGSTYGATEPPCTLPHIFLGKWLLPAPQSENQQHPPQVAPLQPSRRNPSPQQALQAYRTSPHHLKIINAATCGGL